MDDTYAEVGAEVILGRHTHKPWHTPVDTSNQDVVVLGSPLVLRTMGGSGLGKMLWTKLLKTQGSKRRDFWKC